VKVKDKVALVTGAGSGIGCAMACALAQRGCHIALSDINAIGLQQTVEKVSAFKVRVTAHHLDVTDKTAVIALPATMEQLHGGVDLLINNAGIASAGTFEQISEAAFNRVMDINFHAMVNLTRAFLPQLQKRKAAHLVYISSLYGLVSPGGHTAYSASKFAIRGFANALRHELEGTPVRVTVVHPGGIATNIARNAVVPTGAGEDQIRQGIAEGEKFLRMSAAKAGEIIVRGIEKNKPRLVVGNDALFVAQLERVAPVHYWGVMKAIAKWMVR
jgi:short-subunit dehydrogenase